MNHELRNTLGSQALPVPDNKTPICQNPVTQNDNLEIVNQNHNNQPPISNIPNLVPVTSSGRVSPRPKYKMIMSYLKSIVLPTCLCFSVQKKILKSYKAKLLNESFIYFINLVLFILFYT